MPRHLAKKLILLTALTIVPAFAASIVPAAARGWEGAPPAGTWLAGDFHVHSIYSHDVCDPAHPDDRCSEPWTTGFTPGEQLQNAEARGLDFMTLTDHNTVAAFSDSSWTGYSGSVVKIPGQELSLNGHAGAINYALPVDRGTGSVADVERIINEIHAAGGLFSINHPAEDGAPWEYGSSITGFDSIEIWNINWTYPDSHNPDALGFYESWLDSGKRVPGLGGSDSHWIATSQLQGVGQPTTWVYAPAATPAGVVAGIRAGRTFVSSEPPAFGGARLFLEADGDRDGVYGTLPGSELRGSGPKRIRVTVENGTGNTLRLVTNGGRVLATEEVLLPDEQFTFNLTLKTGAWIRADLFPEDPNTAMTAISSPIYVAPSK